MANVKLNQIIAIEKGEKGKHNSDITKLHRLSDQPQFFNGFSKVYQPNDEEGEKFPPESKLVQANVDEAIEAVSESLSSLFDVVATKDFGNTKAVSDIVLEDGTKLLESVPATFLLFLEKQLNEIGTFVAKLPVLDPAEAWVKDEGSGLFKSEIRKTHKTKKVQKPIVLHAPTPEHPAQTQLITEDEIVGYWSTTNMSGAMQATRKKTILDRISALIKAVKFARENANNTDVDRKEKIGEKVINFLFV